MYTLSVIPILRTYIVYYLSILINGVENLMRVMCGACDRLYKAMLYLSTILIRVHIECYSYFKDILYYLSILINGVENPIM